MIPAESLFNDYESQSRGPKPNPPANNRAGASSPQLDNMMRDNLNIKKPAGAHILSISLFQSKYMFFDRLVPQQQGPQRTMPMNQLNNANVGVRTPPPTHHGNNSPQVQHNSPLPTHQPPPSQPAPQPFVDLFGSDPTPQPKTPQAPKEGMEYTYY